MTDNPLLPAARLCSKALSVDDMTPGRRVYRFNLEVGKTGPYTVTEGEHIARRGTLQGEVSVVTLEKANPVTGQTEQQEFPCSDLGLIGADRVNDRNFVIDVADEASLPEPQPGLFAHERHDYPLAIYSTGRNRYPITPGPYPYQ